MSDWYEAWVTVLPAPGAIEDTARALLALAEDPNHVLTQGNGSHFLVPLYLADAYSTPLKKRPARKRAGEQ